MSTSSLPSGCSVPKIYSGEKDGFLRTFCAASHLITSLQHLHSSIVYTRTAAVLLILLVAQQCTRRHTFSLVSPPDNYAREISSKLKHHIKSQKANRLKPFYIHVYRALN